MSLSKQLTGHTSVQASAGSGKTYLLISRIVRLLLNGADAGNILAITFTKKAANEMQTRLLERLYELATCDENKLSDILIELDLELKAKTLTRARHLYEEILRSESPVKTSTFHAFCQELLRRFPMEANVSPGFDLLDKTSLFYTQAWDALMLEAKDKADLASALQTLFKELALFNSKKALFNFIEHRSDWWAYTTDKDDSVAFARQKLEKQIGVDLESDPIETLFSDKNNITLLNEFHVLLCKNDTKTNLKISDIIYKIIDKDISAENYFTLFKQCFLTKTGTALARKESKTQAKKMGEDGQDRFLELHQVLSQKLIDTNSNLAAIRTIKISSAWYQAGQALLDIFQRLKKEQRLLDFTDLEWQTYLLLNKSNNALWVQYKLDQRIEHLLVDEFQDTNPTQWRLILPLLEEIAASNDERQRSVFIVGDQKQSIYRFRRAEPRLFTAAEDWLKTHLQATPCVLTHSWRSSPAIMSFINTLFSQDKFKALLPSFSEHTTHRETLSGKVTLLPLAKKELVDDEEKTELTRPLRNPLEEPRKENISKQYFNEGMLIANKIEKLIKNNTAVADKDIERAMNYQDIIILLKNRTHVSEYEQALRQKGIPYIGANRGTLLECLEIADMLDLLHWLILPFDNLSLAGILRSPLFNISNDELIAIKQSSKGSWKERLEKFVETNPQHAALTHAHKLLSHWQEAASKLPVHDLLDKIYSEANVIKRYIAAFPQHLEQRVFSNLTRFLELALEMDSGRYPSLTRFTSWLSELRQLDNEAPDEPVTSTEETQRVRILTVHSAKGLEAPVVFLADSANSPSNKNAYSSLVDWPAESEKPDYFLLTSSKIKLDEFSKSCISQQELLSQRENANLLYVALTRAKQHLYISASESSKKDHGWYESICSAYEFNLNESEDEIILEQYGQDGSITPNQKIKVTKNKAIEKELSLPIKLNLQNNSISPSQQGVIHFPDTETKDENTLRGTIMHQMLNYLTRFPDKLLAQFNSSELNGIESNQISSWWDECQAVIKDDKFTAYFTPSSYDKFYNEVPLHFKEGDEEVYGIIDRLIIKDNTATIIDYKTHPYVNEKNIQQISDIYRQQMQLYKNGVQLLWPNYKINSVLLFTAIQQQFIFTE